MGPGFVFTPEMGARLCALRKKAGLTQAEVARRMGLDGAHVNTWISSLESGRIREPKLGSVVLFVKACGAVMSEFFDQFNAIDLVPVEEMFNEAWDKAGLVIPEREWPKWARARPDAKATVREKTKWEVMKYQLKAVFPLRGKPVERDKARAQAQKLAEYRIPENIVRRAVFEYINQTKQPRLFIWPYTLYARSILSVIRKFPDDLVAQELSIKRDSVARHNLDPEIAQGVERAVLETWKKLRG